MKTLHLLTMICLSISSMSYAQLDRIDPKVRAGALLTGATAAGFAARSQYIENGHDIIYKGNNTLSDDVLEQVSKNGPTDKKTILIKYKSSNPSDNFLKKSYKAFKRSEKEIMEGTGADIPARVRNIQNLTPAGDLRSIKFIGARNLNNRAMKGKALALTALSAGLTVGAYLTLTESNIFRLVDPSNDEPSKNGDPSIQTSEEPAQGGELPVIDEDENQASQNNEERAVVEKPKAQTRKVAAKKSTVLPGKSAKAAGQ